jgi:hypothetical protein
MASALAAERDCAAGDMAAWRVANFLAIDQPFFLIMVLLEYVVKKIFLKCACVLYLSIWRNRRIKR